MNYVSDEFERVTGIRMSDEEIVEFLRTQGHGVLSLANRNDSYGVPVSFGYTEDEGTYDAIYLYLLQFGEDSKKLEFVERTKTACMVAYNVESRDTWRSVIVTGALREQEGKFRDMSNLTDCEYIDDIMVDNA